MNQTRFAVLGCGLGVSLAVLAAAPVVTAATDVIEYKQLRLQDLMNIQVKEVTTASKRAELATQTPGMTYVIDKNDIKLRGYSTLKDVLRDLPGMEVQEYAFVEDGTEVRVRGIGGNNRIVVLVNGMRVNPPGGENFPFRSDFSVRDAEQIEVIYGSGSTLYGHDAVSLVINVITKRPESGAHGEIGADGGMNYEREVWGTFGGLLDKEKNISLTGYVQYHDSDLTRLDKEYPKWWQDYYAVAQSKGVGTAQTDREDFGMNVFTRLEAGDFSLQTWFRDSQRCSSDSVSPNIGFTPQATWDDYSIVAEAKYVLHFSDTVRLDSAATFNRYEVDPSSAYVWPANANAWYNDYKFALGYSYTLEETLHVDFTPKLSMLAGLTFGQYDIVPKCSVPGGASDDMTIGQIIQKGGSLEYYTANGGPFFIPRVWHTTYQNYGGYVEGNWQVIDRVKLMGGLRLDNDSRIVGESFTPRAAIIWNPTDEWTMKYTFSTAYISPSPYNADNVYQNGTQISTTNPGLQPERSMTHEIDFNYTKKNFQLGLALYRGEQNNLIQGSDRALDVNKIGTVYLDPAHTQPMSLIQAANGGSSYNEGVDFYGRATFGPVSPWFSYSYITFQAVDGNVSWGLEGISQHNGRFGVTWAVTPKLFVTPSLSIRSTPENIGPGQLATELKTPYEIRLHMLWAMAKHVEVFADLRNITDNHNALNGLYGTAVPQETFSAVCGVRINY